jgi:hypothetical protein
LCRPYVARDLFCACQQARLSGVSSLRARNFLARWRLVRAPLCHVVSLRALSFRAEFAWVASLCVLVVLAARQVKSHVAAFLFQYVIPRRYRFCRELVSHQHTTVVVFVELLNPSSLARNFVIARALTRFVSSPARFMFNPVVVPRVIKKFQESSEDGASNVIFIRCATKSSDILRDSSSIRQNYSIGERSSAIDYRRKEDPWMTSTGTRSRACDYCVELVRVSKFVIRISGLMDGLTR